MADVNLPAVIPSTTPALAQITAALGVSRDVLAGDDEIQAAWSGLPRILRSIPPEYGSQLLARMCVAVAVGLFDSAVNYAWNSAVMALREKVRRFGLSVVAEITRRDFDDTALLDLKDAELLSLCLSLNLISEDGFFLLNQCRDVRNNFSAAHPPIGVLDDHEFLNFLNRCARYALADTHNPTGVHTQEFVAAIRGGRFTDGQQAVWVERLQHTHEAQRELLFGMLHGMYCDPDSSEEIRRNAVELVHEFTDQLLPRTRSALIDRHAEYVAKGDGPRTAASRTFFIELGLLGLLTEAERHSIITSASEKLLSVHHAIDNFYNEPPFAQRLLEISRQTGIPATAKEDYVTTVVTCAAGNPYGVSNAAFPAYAEMIRNFSPQEIAVMLLLPDSKTIVGDRIRGISACKRRYRTAVGLLDSGSIPTQVRPAYERWIDGK